MAEDAAGGDGPPQKVRKTLGAGEATLLKWITTVPGVRVVSKDDFPGFPESASCTRPAKKRPVGRPVGSKNKKPKKRKAATAAEEEDSSDTSDSGDDEDDSDERPNKRARAPAPASASSTHVRHDDTDTDVAASTEGTRKPPGIAPASESGSSMVLAVSFARGDFCEPA